MIWNLLSETVGSGTSSGSNTGGNNSYLMWIMLALLLVVLGVMMFTSSRANKKRQKEAEAKLNGLRVGDKVKTIGGICGTIVEIDDSDNTFVLETGTNGVGGNYIKFDKVAVYESTHPEDIITEGVTPEEPAENAEANESESPEGVTPESVTPEEAAPEEVPSEEVLSEEAGANDNEIKE